MSVLKLLICIGMAWHNVPSASSKRAIAPYVWIPPVYRLIFSEISAFLCKRDGAVSGRSAALAALLTEAPQCVPFTQRVLIFRSLVAADKERCVT